MQIIWLNGANSQIGQAIRRAIDPMEFEMLNTDLEELDISNMNDVLRFAEINRPDVIINCAGVTNVEICKQDPKLAYRVNALGARNLSIAASKISAKLVQISTDDVFDGKKKTPYNEFDQTNPITVYGKSKLAGENYVKEFTFKHFIIRSTWVYGLGKNFVTSVLGKVKKGETLIVPSNEYGSPTSAKELANFILHLIHTNEYGTYHATCKGMTSRLEFANAVLQASHLFAPNICEKEVEQNEVGPAYAVLDNFIMSIVDVYEFSHWKTALEEYIQEEWSENGAK